MAYRIFTTALIALGVCLSTANAHYVMDLKADEAIETHYILACARGLL